MAHTSSDKPYWHKQTVEEPLFPDLLWSRPENRNQAGKLLIVGGNAHGFSAAGEAYTAATDAGIGTARVLLPDSLQKTVGKVFAAGEYAPSTPSGSFSRQSLAELLSMGEWADGLLLAGDFGRNSETAIVLEELLGKYKGQLTLTEDAVDYFMKAPVTLLQRENTMLVLSFVQLQKLATGARFTTAFTFDMDFLRLVEALHHFTEKYPATIITQHLNTVFAAINGQVSTTKLTEEWSIWQIKTASAASVWWLQNPDRAFQALSTSLLQSGVA
jgi:NAD(P)H-hydrate repair Nnr-like enzyme with NAD(P)H-hydrate dehydratase domain